MSIYDIFYLGGASKKKVQDSINNKRDFLCRQANTLLKFDFVTPLILSLVTILQEVTLQTLQRL